MSHHLQAGLIGTTLTELGPEAYHEVLTVAAHLLHQKNPTCRALRLPTISYSLPDPCQRSAASRSTEGQTLTAVRGYRNWSPPKYPQEVHSLLIASLPCKQRPGNVEIRCWIFIFCHGSALSHRRDSATQSSLKSGKTRQEIYQMTRACPFVITQTRFFHAAQSPGLHSHP